MVLPQRGFQGNGGAGRGGAPYKPPVGKSTIKGSPGLLTSTGGLQGTAPLLLMPVFDQIGQRTNFNSFDPTDFNCEDPAFYFFRQEDVMPGRAVSVHRVYVFYRELGEATFNVGVVVYRTDSDSFASVQQTVKIRKPKKVRKGDLFPSFTIRMKKVSLVIDGERPQVFISRLDDQGPLAITRVMMIGHADETDQV